MDNKKVSVSFKVSEQQKEQWLAALEWTDYTSLSEFVRDVMDKVVEIINSPGQKEVVVMVKDMTE